VPQVFYFIQAPHQILQYNCSCLGAYHPSSNTLQCKSHQTCSKRWKSSVLSRRCIRWNPLYGSVCYSSRCIGVREPQGWWKGRLWFLRHSTGFISWVEARTYRKMHGGVRNLRFGSLVRVWRRTFPDINLSNRHTFDCRRSLRRLRALLSSLIGISIQVKFWNRYSPQT